MIYYRLSGLLLRCALYIIVFIIVSLYAHTCNIYAHFPLFYTLIGRFLTPLDLHIQVYGYFIADQKFGKDHTCYEKSGVLFTRSSYLGIILCLPCLFLLILCIVWTQFILLIIHRIVISRVRNLCHIAVTLSPS